MQTATEEDTAWTIFVLLQVARIVARCLTINSSLLLLSCWPHCWYRFYFDTPTLFFPHSVFVLVFYLLQASKLCVFAQCMKKKDKYSSTKVERKSTEKSKQYAVEKKLAWEKSYWNSVYKQLPLYAMNENQ